MKLRLAQRRSLRFELDLSEHADGLICLTGGEEGPLAAALRWWAASGGSKPVKRLTEIFGRLSFGQLKCLRSELDDIFIARKNIEIGLH